MLGLYWTILNGQGDVELGAPLSFLGPNDMEIFIAHIPGVDQ